MDVGIDMGANRAGRVLGLVMGRAKVGTDTRKWHDRASSALDNSNGGEVVVAAYMIRWRRQRGKCLGWWLMMFDS